MAELTGKGPHWAVDELILALNLYFEMDLSNTPAHPSDQAVIDLSETLNALPIHQARTIRFRNPNGVAMKLANFRSLDPNYHGKGLVAGSKLDKEVWDQYAHRPDELSQVAKAILSHYQLAKELIEKSEEDPDLEEFPEGRVLEIIHRSKERSKSVVEKKKQQTFAQTGNLACEVCQFDFAKEYPDLGFQFAECHHKIPLAELTSETKTRVQDLAIVCANCHRMIHRRGAPRTFEDFVAWYWENH